MNMKPSNRVVTGVLVAAFAAEVGGFPQQDRRELLHTDTAFRLIITQVPNPVMVATTAAGTLFMIR